MRQLDGELELLVLKVEAMAEQQHRLASAIVAQFIEFTRAMEPLLTSCSDPEVLTKACEDIKRINGAVIELAREGGILDA